ncbi:hypothetical protein JL04_05550 [Gallibacterium anatis]|nr:hypothetical protein JL04_05550 [Gallibacterium anatis]
MFLFDVVAEGICKMLEMIDKSDKARKFAYVVLILFFIFSMAWISPNLLKAISELLLTLKTI